MLPRIVLADDHTRVVEGFRKLLDPEFEIAAFVSDVRSLLNTGLEIRPDVVVLDLGLPLLSGMEAGKELKRLWPLTKIVVVTMNEDPDVARVALGSGHQPIWSRDPLSQKSRKRSARCSKADPT